MTIHIKTRVESETLVLPELRPFVSKTVEIRVTEASESTDDHARCIS